MQNNRSSIFDFINEMEEKYPVDQWTIEGIHIWPVLRISLAMQLFRQNISNENIPNRNIINKANDYSRKIAKLIKMLYLNHSEYKNIHNSKVDYLFIGDQVSRIWLNNAWYDRFCDPFIEHLNNIGKKSVHMEPHYDTKSPNYRSTRYLQPRLDCIRAKSLLRKPYNINNMRLNNYNLFANEIHSRFPELDKTINIVPRQMGFVLNFSAYFEKILSVIKPKAVFIVEYYNIIAMSIILACKRLNIPTIDIQHGVQGDLHIAYGRWQKVPGHGFNLLPDYFWVWSESEANAINNWRLENDVDIHKPFAGGNIWIEMWKSDRTKLVQSYDKAFKKKINIGNNSILILFTLQPLTFDEKYPEWVVDAISHSPENWIWLIRVHPCMLTEREKVKEYFVRDGNARIEIDLATDQPLPIILRNADVHITSFSSTVLEAQDFGVYSVIIDYRGEEVYNREIETGWVVPANNEPELIKAINMQVLKRQKGAIQADDIEPTAKISRFLDIVEKDYGGNSDEK